MKKILLLISMISLLFLLSGCKKETQTEDANNISPTQQPIVTLPAEVTPQENPTQAATEDDTATALTIKAYYPLHAEREYDFEGEGNEYAAYRKYIDFIDEGNNRIQTRTNNGGTETINVIEIKGNKVSVIETINECYYRDNIMQDAVAGEDDEILLMEPLKKGTQWTLPDGRKRYISDTEMQIVTPAGSYKAIEVTTESSDSITKDYYALGVGLVKSVFQAEDMEVSSSLSEINSNTPFTQLVDVFYPDADEKIYVESVELSFHTNDATKTVMEDTFQREADKESYLPLASENTIINSLYLGEEETVYVDFSADFVSDMNAGAGYETLIIQSVTNTLGNYYGVQRVCITLDGEPYESGHVIMKEGDSFLVNMEQVVR